MSKARIVSVSPKLPEAVSLINVAAEDPVEFRAGIMTAGDLGFLVGDDGTMKSTLALHLAGALAGGYRFLGHFETDVTQCLIVSEEDSASVIRNRVEAMCRGMGWDERRVLEGICVIARAEARLTSKQWQVHLLSEIEQLQPSLVILDPLAELMTGEENSNSEARGVIQTMRALSAPSGANVLAIHHFGKPAEGKRRIDLFRGASALRSASRFTYALDNDSQAHELTVTCEKLSRSEKLAPFVVRYHIESEPNNRAAWTLARFDYVNAQVATLDRADAFVLEQLQGGERMTTTDLKTAAKGTGVSAVDIAKALKTLEMRRIIDHAEGPKNAKLWGLAEPGRWLPENSRQPRQPENEPARQPDCLPGNQNSDLFCLPRPYRAGSKHGQDSPARQPETCGFAEPDETDVAVLESQGFAP